MLTSYDIQGSKGLGSASFYLEQVKPHFEILGGQIGNETEEQVDSSGSIFTTEIKYDQIGSDIIYFVSPYGTKITSVTSNKPDMVDITLFDNNKQVFRINAKSSGLFLLYVNIEYEDIKNTQLRLSVTVLDN